MGAVFENLTEEEMCDLMCGEPEDESKEKKYTFAFSGELVIIADSEEEAYRRADDLLATTQWQADNCESHTVDEIDLIDTEDIEE